MRHLLASALLLAAPALALAAPPDWAPTRTFSRSMNVVAVLTLDGAAADYEHDLLAAFVGGEPRGLAVPVRLNTSGQYVFFLTAGSNDARGGETVTFKAYDASTDTERTLCEKLVFRDGTSRGTPGAPFAFHTAGVASADGCPLHWTTPKGFPMSMVVNAAVLFEHARTTDLRDRVAALVGGELRGIGEPVVGPDGKQYYQMTVWGDVVGEEVTFQTYDASTGLTYAPPNTVRFAANAVEGTASRPIFLDASVPLPVELTSFTATRDGAGVQLAWTTAGETNNAGFHVEVRGPGDEGREEASSRTSHRAPRASEWRALGFVAGHGTTREQRRYSYHVEDLAPGRYAFRLRQVDFDGTSAYGPEVEARVGLEGAFHMTEAYPNPSRGALHFRLSMAHTQPVRVAVYDVLGREVARLHEGTLEGDRVHALTIDGAAWPAGVYVIRVEGERFRASRPFTRAG